MGSTDEATVNRRLAGVIAAFSRAPLLTSLGYVSIGATVAALTGGVPLTATAHGSAVALLLWLAASAALLYIALSNASNASNADNAALAQARDAQNRAESRLDVVVSSLPDALVVADLAGRIRLFNPSAEHLFGYSAAEVEGEPMDGLFADPYGRQQRERMKEFLATGSGGFISRGREMLARGKNGKVFPCEVSIAEMERDRQHRFVAVIHDVSTRKHALARLDVAEKVLESTMEGVMVTNRSGVIMWVNQAFCRISGYAREEVLGQPASMLKSGMQPGEFYAAMWNVILKDGEWAGEIWNRRKDGEAYPEWLTIKAICDHTGQVTSYVGVFSDISKHKRAEETIRTLTYYDPVTHLPNRDLFMDRLAQGLERAQRQERKVALVMIGLDRFRTVNETLGHQVGDQLLRMVADRLAGCLRGHDTVARLRGDTFCCLLTDLAQSHDAHLVIARLLDCFSTFFEIGGHELFVTASLGISVFPLDAAEPDDLVVKAETAMSRSKKQGEAVYQFYTPEMNTHSVARLQLETDLRKAIQRQEFVVYYQPKIETTTGRVVGAEALLRWHHRELGMVSPNDFIPMAEETGLIVPIGNWVLDHVCQQISLWQAEGVPAVQVAVNLSAHQFRQPDLVERVVEALKTHRIDPALIELELTESAVMRNAEMAISTLMELHGHGVRLAVDDFGTGYSSLSYLKRFPLDKLKIDRSFIHDVDTNATSAEIVGAIIAMAHSLNLSVIGEGVERAAQLSVLGQLHCDEIQGFYYSRPIPAQTFAEILRLGKVVGNDTAS
jgi:diguanylate cyclase (GGDEF)-like protein/PAS domain S-box-containing protein